MTTAVAVSFLGVDHSKEDLPLELRRSILVTYLDEAFFSTVVGVLGGGLLPGFAFLFFFFFFQALLKHFFILFLKVA